MYNAYCLWNGFIKLLNVSDFIVAATIIFISRLVRFVCLSAMVSFGVPATFLLLLMNVALAVRMRVNEGLCNTFFRVVFRIKPHVQTS